MIATKPYIFQRWKQTILILLAAYSSPLMSAAQITPLILPSLPQNEEALLLDALNTEPEILEGGYRQYDLIAARLNTWNDGPRNITVRLLLPPEDGVPPFPLVAYIHGGGFIGGSSKIKILDQKSRFGYAMRALLDEGFAVASMDYRQAREAGWPAPVSDVVMYYAGCAFCQSMLRIGKLMPVLSGLRKNGCLRLPFPVNSMHNHPLKQDLFMR